MAKIYISSTYQDLKDYREAVYKALRKNRHDVISMEDYVSENQKPLQKCLEDLLLAIYTLEYMPEDMDLFQKIKKKSENPSITELKYIKSEEKETSFYFFT